MANLGPGDVLASIPDRIGYYAGDEHVVALVVDKRGAWSGTGVFETLPHQTPVEGGQFVAREIESVPAISREPSNNVVLVGYGPEGAARAEEAMRELGRSGVVGVAAPLFAVDAGTYRSWNPATQQSWSESRPLGESAGSERRGRAPLSSIEARNEMYARGATQLSAQPSPERTTELQSMNVSDRFNLAGEHLTKLGDLDGLGFRPGELEVLARDQDVRDALVGPITRNRQVAQGALTAYQHAPDGPGVKDLACLGVMAVMTTEQSYGLARELLRKSPPDHKMSNLLRTAAARLSPQELTALGKEAAAGAFERLTITGNLERAAQLLKTSFPQEQGTQAHRAADQIRPAQGHVPPSRAPDVGQER